MLCSIWSCVGSECFDGFGMVWLDSLGAPAKGNIMSIR